MYVYIRSEPGLWTVGHYSPQGKFIPESDHNVREEAAARVHYLNGSKRGDHYQHKAGELMALLDITNSNLKSSRLEVGALLECIEQMDEYMPNVPDANCRCHLSPPCSDCVEWSSLREVIETIHQIRKRAAACTHQK
jgi:hypothetical protein